ncbi:acyltransferase family protein [Bradyrhizobium sp.]|uniref:acyltransferase family protein n=1 Tax=Bradyrhizobium sp. TaxID=376 RepID=UPI0025BEFEF8|nr:acyltransferase [Bradyrhizobium sp.]MBV8918536.1 acyltransferase [Bradyrhizobium sp.]
MSATRQLNGIQYLRGLAAALVVAEHANLGVGLPKYFGRTPVPFEFYGGPAGVDLFFVVSGFIIAYITLEPSSLRPRGGVGDFLWRRFARIVPFLWLCVATYAALRFVGRDGSFELEPYLRALTLFPIGPVNPSQAWTLRHEVLFYLVFATIFWRSGPRLVLVAAWMLSPIVVLALVGSAQPTPPSELIGFAFNRLNLLFGFGFLASLAYLRRPDWFVPKVPNGMTVLTSLCGLYLLLFMLISYTHLATADVVLAGIGASLILYVALRARTAPTPGLIERVGLMLGDASYAIYLTHGAVISAILGAWSHLAPGSSVLVVALGCIAGSLGTGILVHRTIERPMVRWLQDFRFGPRMRETPTLMSDTTSKLG